MACTNLKLLTLSSRKFSILDNTHGQLWYPIVMSVLHGNIMIRYLKAHSFAAHKRKCDRVRERAM